VSTIPPRVIRDVRDQIHAVPPFSADIRGCVAEWYQYLGTAQLAIAESKVRHGIEAVIVPCLRRATTDDKLPGEVCRPANGIALVLIDTLEGMR
jgi:hypothetical protein